MRKTLSSLALVKANWDTNHKDYIENFVPLVVNIIKNREYEEISPSEIRKDFSDDYGFLVPHHPMLEILNRVRKQEYISRRDFKYFPNRRKLESFDLQKRIDKQNKKIKDVLEAFVRHVQQNYDVPFNINEAENALIGFLKKHDLDILFASEGQSLLPSFPERKDSKFLASKFIEHAYEEEPELFRHIVDISIGHILANAITFSEQKGLEGSLSETSIYFDTGFIFRVLGYGNIPNQEAYVELLTKLKEDGATLNIFEHTFREVELILANCRAWLRKGNYDLAKANPALRYFVQLELSESDVDQIILNLRSNLEGFGFNIVEKPSQIENVEFQIDEESLNDHIIRAYKEVDPLFDEEERKNTVLRDIESVSAIHHLRRGGAPQTIKDCGHIFVTTNASLAFAARKAESSQMSCFLMPACMTDVFLGTLVWLQSPAMLIEINAKKLIADCLAALQPGEELLKKYFQEIEKLEKAGKISNDEYYLLRTYHVALNLLEEKTMGDPNRFSEKTVGEILDDIRRETLLEAENRLLLEQKEHEITRRRLLKSEVEKQDIERILQESATKWAKIIGNSVFILLVGICFASVLYTSFRGFGVISGNAILLWIAGAIALLTAIVGIAFGFNLWGLRNQIIGKIGEHLLKALKERQEQHIGEIPSEE